MYIEIERKRERNNGVWSESRTWKFMSMFSYMSRYYSFNNLVYSILFFYLSIVIVSLIHFDEIYVHTHIQI